MGHPKTKPSAAAEGWETSNLPERSGLRGQGRRRNRSHIFLRQSIDGVTSLGYDKYAQNPRQGCSKNTKKRDPRQQGSQHVSVKQPACQFWQWQRVPLNILVIRNGKTADCLKQPE